MEPDPQFTGVHEARRMFDRVLERMAIRLSVTGGYRSKEALSEIKVEDLLV